MRVKHTHFDCDSVDGFVEVALCVVFIEVGVTSIEQPLELEFVRKRHAAQKSWLSFVLPNKIS